ncbi:MAG: hypothetical protein ABIQ89_03425 [Candidatus Saccharimonadales bacterium]
MVEELKLPLVQIARQAELSSLPEIELSAAQALWFVDSFLLSRQLQQSSLQLEPVAVAAVLQDTAHALDALAKQYNCGLELEISGRYVPAMAHRQGLQAALVGLGSTLITANQTTEKSKLVLAVHRTRGGIVAGIFSQAEGLSQSVYNRGRALHGQARQPMQELTANSSAGVFVADALFESMESRLRVARHNKLTGLAATLQQSRQLALI